jgi:hypothetical protein
MFSSPAAMVLQEQWCAKRNEICRARSFAKMWLWVMYRP